MIILGSGDELCFENGREKKFDKIVYETGRVIF